MSFIVFFFLATTTILLSIKISCYVDSISRANRHKGFLITGILLSGITSLPELVTSITAVQMKNPSLAIGDILGSNAFNIFMIAIIDIIFIKKAIFNKMKGKFYLEYLIMIISYTLIYIYIIINPTITILSVGLPSIFLLKCYIIYILNLSKSTQTETGKSPQKGILLKLIICAILMITCSFFLTMTVNYITTLYPAISGSVIGAILLGVTTSLPEVITFIMLIKLNNYDMALTGIIGSNIFNLLVLTINDIVIKTKNIYLYTDYGSILLIKIMIIITSLSFIQVLWKKRNNKLIYIFPTLIIVGLYIFFLTKGLGK